MAVPHGKVTHIEIDNAAGSLVDLSSYCDEVGYPSEVSTHETTTFKKNSVTRIVGLADGSLSMSGPYDPTIDAHMNNLKNAFRDGTITSATYKYGPEGNATGKRQYTGELVLKSYEVNSPVGEPPTFSAEFDFTGDQSSTTF